ncbi:hypothetical protein [Kitasatospora sp. CB01950]|uniref:hypothetical protein n=1 Tax=Kitasatospora sp. CB01950 TaxID=1703930 RepID=UPI00093B0D46|nr:hypothetical protein [Kitasatospora sp. CB01950]OKJ05637.1 hypothetical protein AMK19_25420 [Kitasatospora sp. CB01950]
MRAIKRVLAIGALTAPLVMGCAGLASAQEGLDANFGQGQFVAGGEASGVGDTNSAVGADGAQHADFWIWSDSTGVSGAGDNSGAGWPGQ